MSDAYIDTLALDPLLTPDVRSFCVGWINHITAEGQALVDYPSNAGGPVRARSIVVGPLKNLDNSPAGIPVLLVFENGDPGLPIIVGIIRDTLSSPVSQEEVTSAVERPRDIVLDGKKVVLEANAEIVLRCGKSSITLKKDGKIVVKGTQIISRASGAQKIRGASVNIN
jgi:hypothetical protein